MSSSNKILLSKRIVTPVPGAREGRARSTRLPYSVQEAETNPAPPPTPVDYFLDHHLESEELDTLSSLDEWDDVSVDSSAHADDYNIESNNDSSEFSTRSFTVAVTANESLDNQAGNILRHALEDEVFESASDSTLTYKSEKKDSDEQSFDVKTVIVEKSERTPSPSPAQDEVLNSLKVRPNTSYKLDPGVLDNDDHQHQPLSSYTLLRSLQAEEIPGKYFHQNGTINRKEEKRLENGIIPGKTDQTQHSASTHGEDLPEGIDPHAPVMVIGVESEEVEGINEAYVDILEELGNDMITSDDSTMCLQVMLELPRIILLRRCPPAFPS